MTLEELNTLKMEVEAVKKENARLRRKARDQAMKDLGLTKVRGCVSGKTYWE